MKQKRKEKNLREDNHDHPPREGGGDGCEDPREENNNVIQSQGMLSQEGQGKNATEEEKRIQSMTDGGYKRRIVRCRHQWEKIITDYGRLRGWEEGMNYDWDEEEKDSEGRIVGPCMDDYEHIGPDEEDWRYEDEDYNDTDWTREEFRRWVRPPFKLPRTDQDKYYSTTLMGLDTSKRQLQRLWDTVRDLTFQDGRIPDFLGAPIKSSILRIRRIITSVHNTMKRLNFNTNKLNPKVDANAKPPKQEVKHWEMTKIISQLEELVRTTRHQVDMTGRYMRNSKEWIIACDWKDIIFNLDRTTESLTSLRYRVKPTYKEGNLIRGAEFVWSVNNWEVPITNMDTKIDEMTGKIIEKYEEERNVVNLKEEDKFTLKNTPDSSSISQTEEK